MKPYVEFLARTDLLGVLSITMTGLDNFQLDAYLARKVRRLEIIRSDSYEAVFTIGGDLRRNIHPARSWGMIVNMDTSRGPGNHWIALIVYPADKTIFYYDPLLPNTNYKIPPNMQNYFIKQQLAGYRVIENMAEDQVDYKGRINTMCGAYAVGMLLGMDSVSDQPISLRVDKFFALHKKLSDARYVTSLYTAIKQN